MKNTFIWLLILASLSLYVASRAHADVVALRPNYEFTGSSLFSFSGSSGGGNTADVNLNVVAQRFVSDQIEIGMQANFENYLNSGTWSFLLDPGLTYNFSTDIANSLWISGFLGLESGLTDTFGAAFNWQIRAGKRIFLAEHVSWSPFATFGMSYGGGVANSMTTWNIAPFSFSILF